jgi:hypothetical protein
MHHTTPERIVFRFHENFQFDEAAIIEAFFTSFGPVNDYYSHLCPPEEHSNKMYIVLDIHARTILPANPLQIKYRVFKVQKDGQFYFTELNESACEYARQRCTVLNWGTDRRRSIT